MIGARRQIELGHRRPHQTLTLLPSTLLRTSLQPAKLPYLPQTHIRITDNVSRTVIREARERSLARGLRACANRLRRFTHTIPAQFFIINSWDFDAAAPYQFYPARDPRCAFDISSPGHERRPSRHVGLAARTGCRA
jgi:hypothetical protein